jgi:hypothetical protein
MADTTRPRLAKGATASTLALALSLFVSGCDDFSPIAAGVCGNGVVEDDGEDCDLLTPNPEVCHPPGKPGACRFVCSASQPCPTGSTCVQGTGICVRETSAFGAPVRVIDGVTATNIDLADTDGDGSFETFVSYNALDATRFFFEIPSNRVMTDVAPRRIPEWPVPPRSAKTLGSEASAGTPRFGIFAPIATGVTMVHRDQGGTVQPDARFGAVTIEGVASNVVANVTHAAVLRRKLGRKGVVRDGLSFASKTPAGVIVGAGWQAADPADISPCEARGGFVKRVDSTSTNIVFVGGANIVEASPCEELVVILASGPDDGGEAHFFDSCNASACPVTAGVVDRSVRLALPPGRSGVLTEATAADIDGDGHVDLLAAWRLGPVESAGTRKKTFTIHIGAGDGTFSGPIPFTVDLLNTDQELFEDAAGLATFRELRDSDGLDGGRTFAIISDRVLRFDGDLVPQPNGFATVEAYQVSWPTGASRWEAPVAEDLDRDGVVDVVLTNGSRIYVLRGNGFGSFGTTVIEAGAPIYSKAVGDYDGDGLLDLAITRELFASSTKTTTLDASVQVEVAYGFGGARLGPWLPVLSLQNPNATLVARRKPDFTGADAVVALAPYRDSGGPALVELAGDGTQGGLFPATRAVCANAGGAPIDANAGTVFRSSSASGSGDLLFVGSKRRSLTNERASFEGVAVAAIRSESVDGNAFVCTPALQGRLILHAAAGNVCGDAGDELFLLHRGDELGASLVSTEGDLTTTAGSLTFANVPVSSRTAAAEVANPRAESTLADLDGDGDLDVLVRLGADAGVAWNETPLASVRCSEAVFRFEPLPLPKDRALLDVDLFNRGEGAAADIVVLHADGLTRYRRGGGGALVELADRSLALVGDGGGTPTAFELADVDGDGFVDAVVADGRGIRIHYGLERPRRSR